MPFNHLLQPLGHGVDVVQVLQVLKVAQSSYPQLDDQGYKMLKIMVYMVDH